jgi:hypothetical protein
MSTGRFFTLILFGSVLFAGCASMTSLQRFEKDAKYRQEIVNARPDLPEEVKTSLLEGIFLQGTDKSVIQDIFGEPDSRFLSESGMAEVWFYEGFSFGFDKKGKLLKLSRHDISAENSLSETSLK